MNEETLKEILEELRSLSKSELYSLPKSVEVYEHQPKVSGKPIFVYFAELADRTEAAVSRLRNALNVVVNLTKIMDYDAGPMYVEAITDKIRTTAAEAGFVFDAKEGAQ